MATLNVYWGNAPLYWMLRATWAANDQVGVLDFYDTTGATLIKYKNVTGTDWNSAADGVITLQGTPLLTTHNNNGTIARCVLNSTAVGSGFRPYCVPATSGPAECVVDSLVISGSSAMSISTFRVGLPASRGTVKFSTTLRNKILDTMFKKNNAHFSAAGTLKVYSGSAPATADESASGTLLWQIATTTTTWNAPSSGISALAAGLTATSEAFGANQVVGYCRFAWTHSAVDYVIQGSVGEGAGDFQFTNLDGGSNNEMAASTSYTMSNASMDFT